MQQSRMTCEDGGGEPLDLSSLQRLPNPRVSSAADSIEKIEIAVLVDW